MIGGEIKTRKPRESNYVNITDTKIREELKECITMPYKDLQLNYVLWYKKDDPNDWGLNIKAFPDEKYGTQHVSKIIWNVEKDPLDNSKFLGLKQAAHYDERTDGIYGELFEKILNIYNKYKK